MNLNKNENGSVTVVKILCSKYDKYRLIKKQ